LVQGYFTAFANASTHVLIRHVLQYQILYLLPLFLALAEALGNMLSQPAVIFFYFFCLKLIA
jgi:hypothetical protein